MNRLRVIIADDQPDVRDALRDLLETDPALEVVGVATSSQEVIAQCAILAPDVVVMDVKMPGGGGAQATKVIRLGHPDTRIVAFSAYEDRRTILDMLSAGALGYVTKGAPAGEILAAIHRAGEGLAVLSSSVSSELVHELGMRLRTEEGDAAARQERVGRIKEAIGSELRMVFQPIVNLETGQIAGVEALARFSDDRHGPPDLWFAEAADVGLGVELERAAFHAAIGALDQIPSAAFLAVNLSPQAMVHPGFWEGTPDNVISRLVLELTEHAAVQDYDELQRALAPLRDVGARLAVDDAGAGFASLRHILLLRANFIKLDASLTRNLHRHRPRRAMASALVSFAAETDATLIAEGIEHTEELQTLIRLGATFGQGFLLAQPADLRDLDLTATNPAPVVTIASAERRGLREMDPCALQASWEPAVEAMLRRLLRVSTSDQAVAELVGLVHELGARTVPAGCQDPDALPVDLSFGLLSEPLLPAAAAGTAARRALIVHLPACVEDVRAVVNRLEESANTAAAAVDPLTGLPNRRSTGPALRAATAGDVVAVLDLDQLEVVNDTFGHDTGDVVLSTFAQTLVRTTREADTCGRFGDDEFLLVLPDTDLRRGVSVVERISQVWGPDRPVAVTFSAGVATVDRRGPEAALAAAGQALFRAKAAGGDCIKSTPLPVRGVTHDVAE